MTFQAGNIFKMFFFFSFFFFLPRADSSGPSCRCKSQKSVAAETQAGVETRESTADIIS